ncbi:MAG: class II fructose-bisphosphate aldolase [Eubacteriales bacterium]|nr:class II fructose-bisphosphate aldolase [Eubacteriales bacterium]
MLVTLSEILELAEAKKCAVGSFNTPNLESIMAVIQAAEELNVPVIIMHAEVHEEMMPIDIIGPIMVERAKAAKVPVCVHLDHGENLSYLVKALNLGFTSVMYDGSTLSYEANVANTKLAVKFAHAKGASVEAEIGSMGKRELGPGHENAADQPEAIYTDPDMAKRFVDDTGIDALACSFGTAHGIYLKAPKLDMGVLERVKRLVDVPIVMHGGSGVSEEDYRKVIERGVRKINYYTYMAKAGGAGVEEKISLQTMPIDHKGKKYRMYYVLEEIGKEIPIYYHDVVTWGMRAMKKNVLEAMRVFSGIKE